MLKYVMFVLQDLEERKKKIEEELQEVCGLRQEDQVKIQEFDVSSLLSHHGTPCFNYSGPYSRLCICRDRGIFEDVLSVGLILSESAESKPIGLICRRHLKKNSVGVGWIQTTCDIA